MSIFIRLSDGHVINSDHIVQCVVQQEWLHRDASKNLWCATIQMHNSDVSHQIACDSEEDAQLEKERIDNLLMSTNPKEK